ncbi:MAG: hypothetical protein A3A94_03575 [Candidatus Portnoybacteria bacterium RIFCSPLOWO2_01_FULL_43_11]|uniref:Uncharacterized protein n=4 Tax=Bacteria candidate phyla TaxID=1783234 RepID=A0A1G2FRV6_9BACT|nr:MAG: hypothetical protein A2713_01910 [candidate division WWE3 bacterium RIFCSPHIGHO2_01_FULL_35_17]OGZ37718.1 MAG: hypothetical protein A3E90_00540 [Candidatus Portnoybacteria bacterium RIFCSPHIGHO2_12_FULL_40_11]OGZ38430.1 MAG: hypothetical protein A3A94_03575 [Candidatus Portnoybacteria bacterium RIFCSPLOWO2_01_FULL_43_11]OGZ40816.1 MAG: hypothetical protein A3I20_02320 [Candidatus Portnoybacteria bacterium RIFCSPLOWO2_02_FULL_40_15]
MTINIITIIIASISALSAFFAAIFAYRTYWVLKSPKVVIETPFNNSLGIRNIGTDIAKNIQEKDGLLKDVPSELWNFVGPIDYLRVKSPGISKIISFKDDKMLQPSRSVIIHFEYENTNGNRFYSKIKVERAQNLSLIYFNTPQLIKWGKI